MKFGEYIREKRLNKKIAGKEFAEMVGISPTYLNDLEKGRKSIPASEKLLKIVETLFDNEDEKIVAYDLAAEANNDIAEDIKEKIKKYNLQNALRILSDEMIQDIKNMLKDLNYIN